MTDHEIYLKYPDVRKAWEAGMSYDALHVYFQAPMTNCECDACDRGRAWQRAEDELEDNKIYCHWHRPAQWVEGEIQMDRRGNKELVCPEHPDVTHMLIQYSRSAE